VEAYCRETKLDFCTDVTNKSLSSTRNRIRLKLLPILKQDYNPQINDALDRLSKLAAEEVGFIEAEANREAALLVTVRNDLITIDRQALLKLHPALRRVVLRQLLVNALNSSKDVESVHVEAMMELAEGRPGRSIDLPDGLGFAAGYGELQLGRDLSQAIPLPVLDGQHRLNIPGVTVLGGWRVTATIDEASESTLDSQGIDPLVAVMDWETAGSELRVRCREAGDSFRPLGLDGDKKLKDFFIDEKVPRLWRDRVPVVVNPVRIVWVAGYRLDDRVKINPATRRLLRLEFTLPSTQKQISLVRPESPG
jgi:tRNA(Ile)-lysidine synthase